MDRDGYTEGCLCGLSSWTNRKVNKPQVCECIYVKCKEKKKVNPVSETGYFKTDGELLHTPEDKEEKKQV